MNNGLEQLSQVVDDEVPNPLKRSAATVGFKQPYSPYGPNEEHEDDAEGFYGGGCSDEEDDMDIQEGEEPDLAAFFGMFPWIEDHSQIALCRTYANYMANKIKTRRP